MRALWLLLLACGHPPPSTVADGCYDAADALCQRVSSCGVLTGSIDSCRTSAIASCCQGDACKRPVTQCKTGLVECCLPPNCTTAINVDVFTACEAGIDKLSCGQLATGQVPLGCVPDAGQ
jgi:hypothetical protein